MARPAVKRWLGGLIGVALVAIVAAAIYLAGTARTDAQPLSDETLEQLCHQGWYVLSLTGGQRAGHAYIASRLVPQPDGTRCLVETEELNIRLAAYGLEVKGFSTVTIEHDAFLVPVRFHIVIDLLGQKQVIEAVRQGDAILAEHTMAGTTTRKTLKTDDTFGSEARLALASLHGELRPGQEFDFQVFEPNLMDLDRVRVKILRTEPVQVGGEPVQATVAEMFSEALKTRTTLWLDASGDLLKMHVPALMDIALVKVEEEEALAEFAPPEIAGSVPLEGDIPDGRSLVSLELEATSTGTPLVELVPALPGRQTVTEGEDPQTGRITIAAGPPPAEAARIPVADPDLQLYLSATEFVQSDDPALVSKAAEIVGDEKDLWRAACTLRRWVYRNMRKRDSYPTPITARECLTELEGDCSEHAMLFVGLARAAGIPAKFVGGLVYSKNAFWYHAWNEVYVGNGAWVALDPSWDQEVADATHLALGEGALDAASFARVCLGAARTMGSLELKVIRYQTKDARADGGA